MRKIARFFARNRNLYNLAYIFLNLVAMATPLVLLKIIIAYLKSPTQNLDFSCEKFLDFSHRTEISAILAYFCSNLVAMATPLVSLKIVIAYLKSPTQNPDFSCEKFLDFLHRTEISAILAYFVQIWLPWQLAWFH